MVAILLTQGTVCGLYNLLHYYCCEAVYNLVQLAVALDATIEGSCLLGADGLKFQLWCPSDGLSFDLQQDRGSFECYNTKDSVSNTASCLRIQQRLLL